MTNEELVSAIQAGERDRLVELWAQVERFVSIQADRRARQLNGYGGVTAEDLCQSGFLAMVEAADRYDAGSGKSFHGFLAFYLQSYFAEAAGYRTSRRDAVDFATGLDAPIPGTDDLTAADTVRDPDAAAAFDEAEQRIWLEQLHEALERALDQIPGEQVGYPPAPLLCRSDAQRHRRGIRRRAGSHPTAGAQRPPFHAAGASPP